jgi:hypothetical protein
MICFDWEKSVEMQSIRAFEFKARRTSVKVSCMGQA